MQKFNVWMLAFVFAVSLHLSLYADDKAPAIKVATVADAIQAIDLAKLPVMKDAKEPVNRTVAMISYSADGDCQAAFKFHQQQLLKLKWTELPGTMVTNEYAFGAFSKSGFTASLSASPSGEPGTVQVSLTLHGNVDLKKLPIPKGLKSVYVGPQIAMYSSEKSVDETTLECHNLLRKQGWVPYGKAGETQFFKLNAVRLTANVSAAPAEMGKAMVSFSAEQLSADIPAPVENVQLQYSDSTKAVLFDTKESEEAIEAFYRDTLGKAGWQATTEKPFQIDWKHGLIFRNKAMDLLELEMYEVEDEKVLRVAVKYQTAAEVEAIEKAAKAALDKKKNTPMPRLDKVKIDIPAQAKLTTSEKKSLDFTVSTGKGKDAAAKIRKALSEAGWEESVTTEDDNLGVIEFKHGERSITLNYVDPGFIPAEITIQCSGVELEAVPAKD